jgi:LuxR family maltose regulon positive regulatory protein
MENQYQYPTQNVGHSAFPLGLIYQIQGQPDKANEICKLIADRAFEEQNSFFMELADVLQAELHLREGQIQLASNWAHEHTPGQLLAMPRYYMPELTFIKAMLAEDTAANHKEIARFLNHMEEHTASIHAKNGLIKVLTLQAILSARTGDEPLALATLERALQLGEPGHWIRQFVDLGPEMANLLRQLRNQGVSPDYVERILTAFPNDSEISPPNQNLPEPLTDHELEVMALLAQRLSNKEIATQLVISPATVRNHTHNIFDKLNVKGRREAVAKASELGILSAER